MMQPNGWLTYVLTILVGLGTIAGYFLGSVDGVQALQTITACLAVFGLRKAIANKDQVGGSHW